MLSQAPDIYSQNKVKRLQLFYRNLNININMDKNKQKRKKCMKKTYNYANKIETKIIKTNKRVIKIKTLLNKTKIQE